MSSENQPQERRSIERYELRLLSLLDPPQADETARQLFTRDVSCEGAFLYTDQPLPVQSRVAMTLYLPANGFGPSKIATQGEVVRTESDGIAVRFGPRYTISKA